MKLQLIIKKYLLTLLILIIAFGSFSSLMSNAAFASLARWSEGVYGLGENIEIEIVISGFAGKKDITGTITAELTGLDVISVENTSGFEINSMYMNGKLTLEILNGKSIVVGDNGQSVICLLKCTTKGTTSKLAVSSVLTGDGVTNTQGKQNFTIKRSQVKVTPDPRGTVVPSTATPVPTPTPTMVIWDTPDVTETPAPTETPTETPEDTSTPGVIVPDDNNDKVVKEDGPASIGSIVFWSAVSLVVGVWIGIAIGASIWKRKSVFMTEDEKKVIGKYR